MDHQIEIITTISEHERSTVFLAMQHSDDSQETGDPVILKRFSGYMQTPILRHLSEIDSQYFPKILKIYNENGIIEVLEEYIEGQELSRILEDTCLTEEKALSYMKQLLEAICILHEQDPPLIHRDIKPENILITNDGHVKLIDFDAAREWENNEQKADTVLLGTRGYAAPEQFGYSQTDVRSDLYSAGIVCRQICEKSHISDEKIPGIKSFCDKATMFDPNERFQSAREMLKALDRIPVYEKNDNIRRKRIISVSAAAGALLILGIVLLIYYLPGRNKAVYNFDIITGDYNYRNIGAWMVVLNEEPDFSAEMYPGLVQADGKVSSEEIADIPFLRFSKSSPQAILFHDYRLEDVETANVYLDRYSDDKSMIIDKLRLRDSMDYSLKNGFICITVEALRRLQNGFYSLIIKTRNDAVWNYSVEICDKPDDNDIPLCTLGSVQYYSINIENEVFFNVFNTQTDIARVSCNGRIMNKRFYSLSNDGKGVALGSDFINESDGDTQKLELEFETEDGKKASAEVIIIP